MIIIIIIIITTPGTKLLPESSLTQNVKHVRISNHVISCIWKEKACHLHVDKDTLIILFIDSMEGKPFLLSMEGKRFFLSMEERLEPFEFPQWWSPQGPRWRLASFFLWTYGPSRRFATWRCLARIDEVPVVTKYTSNVKMQKCHEHVKLMF